ncbi:hypothetical protein MCSV2_160004 [Mucispirillum schaedleri ASF457]|nr:hypothetical protein MCSV2_160004 [Mucispirillum schaedleri ASF457]
MYIVSRYNIRYVIAGNANNLNYVLLNNYKCPKNAVYEV